MASRSRRQQWASGDVFLVPLADGSFGVGQVLTAEPEALNSVAALLFSVRIADSSVTALPSLSGDLVVAALLVTRDLLDSGTWKVVGNRHPALDSIHLPFEQWRAKRFVGVKVVGAGIIRRFLNAFHCLEPWDDWMRPDYLDTLLLRPEKKPSVLILKGGQRGADQGTQVPDA